MANEEIIEQINRRGHLNNDRVRDAFMKVDRKQFLPDNMKSAATRDQPLPIGEGQTNSQPTVVAFMLELLDPQPGEKILDVGAGSGWTTALLAEIVGDEGYVTGVELKKNLQEKAQDRLQAQNVTNAHIELASKELGKPGEAPFDKILVSAAAEKRPKQLLEQLRAGGILVVPIQDRIEKIIKAEPLEVETFHGFRFVPLVTD